jgi:thymidylate synthase
MSILKERGVIVDSAWGERRKELPLFLSVPIPTLEPRFPVNIIGDPKSLQKYKMEIIDGLMDWAVDCGVEAYTYSQRMKTQLDAAIAELKINPNSTRAVITLLQEEDKDKADKPCVNQIQLRISECKLNMNICVRSNDAYKAFPHNAWGFTSLMEYLAEIFGVDTGWFTWYAESFHVYERDWLIFEKTNWDQLRQEAEGYNYRGEDGWKEEMDSLIPEILAENETVKARHINDNNKE